MINKIKENKIKEIVKDYKFKLEEDSIMFVIKVLDKFGEYQDFIYISKTDNKILQNDNTDILNIDFNETRPDLTLSKLNKLIDDINNIEDNRHNITLQMIIGPNDLNKIKSR